MAPRLGLAARPQVPSRHEQPASPISVGNMSMTTGRTRSTGPSPYSSGHDLPGLVHEVPNARDTHDILDIWDTTWFGTPCNSAPRVPAPKWGPAVQQGSWEDVVAPDALAVAGQHGGVACRNPAPIILQQQQLPDMAAYSQQGSGSGTASSSSGDRQPLQPAHGQGASMWANPPAIAAADHSTLASGGLSGLHHPAATAAAVTAGARADSQQLQGDSPLVRPGQEQAAPPAGMLQLPFGQTLEEWAQQQERQQGRQPRASNASSQGCCDAPSILTALGTWTQRQYLLLPPPPPCPANGSQEQAGAGQQLRSSPQQQRAAGSTYAAAAQPIPGSLAPAGSNAGNRQSRHCTSTAAGGAGPDGQQGPNGVQRYDTPDEAAIAAAAWRWRMARRWQNEQQQPQDAANSVPDGADEALQYFNACAVNWQLGRTGSTEPHLAGTADTGRGLAAMGTLDSSFLGVELLASEDGLSARSGSQTLGRGALSREASDHLLIGGPRGSMQASTALQEVTKISKKAAELLKAQGDIEAQVNQRWENMARGGPQSDTWVGALLPGVCVDDWGVFTFVLVRLRGRNGRQRMFVRGSNYSSQGQLLEGLTRQMMQQCAAHGVPAEPLELLGGGTMEWRRNRDRHLFIQQGYAAPSSGMSSKEVMNLTAVLTKQTLALGYKVTVEGGRDF